MQHFEISNHMATQVLSAADVPMLIRSDQTASERRISPAWTITQFKARLEPITGVPATFQRLQLVQGPSIAPVPIEAADEDAVQLSRWPLQSNAEIRVIDTRPPGVRENYTDTSGIEHYIMPTEEYESRSDTVLAWKKAQKLGRFNPDAPTIEQQKIEQSYREVRERDIVVGRRCRLLPESDQRRGEVRFVGDVEEIPGIGAWVGIELDEPTGKNDGSVKGTSYFKSRPNHGVFLRADRVEIGDFPVLDDFADEDEEF